MNEELRRSVESALATVNDPELGIDIVSLGLIYEIEADHKGAVTILMTMTTPGCPMHETIVADVECTIRALPEVTDLHVTVTFSPEWTPERLKPQARFLLGR